MHKKEDTDRQQHEIQFRQDRKIVDNRRGLFVGGKKEKMGHDTNLELRERKREKRDHH